METLERIAARVGRVACSPDNSPESLLESAGLVSELATEFEEFQRRLLDNAEEAPAPAAGSSSSDDGNPEGSAPKPDAIETE